MSSWRIFAALAVALLVVLLLYPSGQRQSVQPGRKPPTEITLWFTGDKADPLRTVAELFETKHQDLPADPAIRANVWADRFREIITSMDVDFVAGDATLFGRHNVLTNGTVVVGEMLSSSFRGMRARQHIQPNDDSHVYLSFNIGSTIQASRQFGREAEARPGEALLAVLDAGIEALAPANGHSLSLKIPAAHFVQWGLTPADLACRKLDCSSADYRLLTEKTT